jgi:hypothetical protein
VRDGLIRSGRKVASLFADRRGAVSVELIFVYPALIMGILLPMFDIAIAGFQYLSARQALHSFGQYLMYSPPDNLADTTDWMTTALAKGNTLGYSISSIQLICGDSEVACSSTNTALPKYFSYSTTVTLTPLMLTSVLCPNSCTYTISYSTRFQ